MSKTKNGEESTGSETTGTESTGSETTNGSEGYNGGESSWAFPPAGKISEWKNKYPEGIHQITVKHPVDKTEHHAVVRQPGLQDMQIAQASERSKAGTYYQSLYENCKLAADPAIANVTAMTIAAYMEMSNVVVVSVSKSKKL